MKKTITAIWVGVALGLVQVRAEVIAHYSFEDVATSVDTQTNSTAEILSNGPGVGPFGYSGASAETPKSMYCYNNKLYSGSEGAAIAANDYFTFSINADSGYDIDFDALSFYTQRDPTAGAGAPDSYSVFTSADGFAASVGTGVGEIIAIAGTTFTQHALDLSSISSLQSVTGSTEFRIYMWTTNGIAGSDQREFRMDDVKVEGTLQSGAPPPVVAIAKYEFQSVATSSDAETNTTAGIFESGPGIGPFDYSGLGTPAKSIYFYNDLFNQTTRTGAITWDDYLVFSVGVDAGYTVAFSTLSFYTQRDAVSGAHAPDSYSVFTSQDGFATSVGTDIGGIVTSTNNSFMQHTLDLSGFANLQSVTDTTEFRIYMWTTTGLGIPSEREFRLDEVFLGGMVGVAPTGSAAYEAWIASFSVGTETNQTDNPDGDSQNNLYEWGLGGNPTDPGDIGHVSTFGTLEDGGTNYLEYVYAMRANATDIGLAYYLETSTDLQFVAWTNDNYEVVDTGMLDGEFYSVTNRMPIDAEPKKFLRLTIEVAD